MIRKFMGSQDCSNPLVGMVHLDALPGSVRQTVTLSQAIDRAMREVGSWVDAGADAIMMENFFDAPFASESVPPITVACLTTIATALRRNFPNMPIGINCLRNDGLAALSIAHAVDAQFIRVNVYVGAAVTDQGLIQGQARVVQLLKRQLSSTVEVWADVFVKHASQLGGADLRIEDHAKDAVYRGLADAVIVTGTGTGFGVLTDDLSRVVAAVPQTAVMVGSGYTPETALTLAKAGATGIIVGMAAKEGFDVSNEVNPLRAKACVRAWKLALGSCEDE